jgi:hypothetical protein
MSKTIKCRAVTFSFLLGQYDIDNLISLCSPHRYAFITHDKDLDEFGEFKKPHVHFFFKVSTPRTLDWFSEYLDIPKNQLQAVKSERAILRYLCHLDNDDKVRYSTSYVMSNFDYQKAILDKDKIDYYQLYDDYLKVGQYLSVADFVKKYNYIMPKQLSSILTVFSKLEERGRQTIFENNSKGL